MSFFSRAKHNKYDEIVAKQERGVHGATPEKRYGENSRGDDPVVIDRGPAARSELSIGQTAEAMASLSKKLCPDCLIVVSGLLAKVAKSEPSSGNVPKLDVFGDNLGTRRTPDSSRPVDLSEALGVGSNPESPQRAALRKKEEASDRIRDACKAFLRLWESC